MLGRDPPVGRYSRDPAREGPPAPQERRAPTLAPRPRVGPDPGVRMMRGWLWRALEGRRNPGWSRRREEFRRLSRLSEAEFQRWQDGAVAQHLEWARRQVPFWAERIHPGHPLAEVPTLQRSDLQTQLDRLVDSGRSAADLRPDASGGSTGQPVRVVHDQAYWSATFATEAWLNEHWGLTPWARTAYLWGDDRAASDVRLRERVRRRLLGRLQLNAFAMDEARMAAFADALARFRPQVVQGYVSALDLFAEFLARTGRRLPRPVLVRSAAETLLPEQRARIEAAFGAPVRDVYGSREAAGLAAQCPEGGFHVLEHGKVLEIVDEAGAPVPPGRPGRVLVTDLTNRALGLIRYENGDVASWAPPAPACPCGSPYRRIERVHGRTSDFLTTPTGERIHGEWFTHLFYGRADVQRFQVRQRALDAVDLLTVGTADATALAGVLASMRARLGPGVRVSWRAVAEIPLSPSGKHRFTLSEVPWRPGGGR